MTRRRAQWSMLVAGAVVVATGFAIALVELLRLPRGSVWIVAGVAVLLLVLVRRVDRG